MSERSTKPAVLLAVAAAIAIALLVLLRPVSAPPPPSPQAGSELAATAPEEDIEALAQSSRRTERRPGKDAASEDAEAVQYLRDQFGATIENKRSQIKAIEKLISYLMKKYPDDWQSRLQALLAQAFPALAGQLWAQFENMSAYNEWLKANREQLAQMDPAERRAAMREAREKYFGSDADEIFAESIAQERIVEAVEEIEASQDKNVAEKLDAYMDAIRDSYGDQAPDFIERRQTELTTKFLQLPSVQDELHQVSAEQRAQQLESVRRAMGMDDDAIERWRTLDGERDGAWQDGERYMEKREEILRTSEGDTQLRQLDGLRREIFGEEAGTIRSEEEAGFFRFGHRRVYGKE